LTGRITKSGSFAGIKECASKTEEGFYAVAPVASPAHLAPAALRLRELPLEIETASHSPFDATEIGIRPSFTGSIGVIDGVINHLGHAVLPDVENVRRKPCQQRQYGLVPYLIFFQSGLNGETKPNIASSHEFNGFRHFRPIHRTSPSRGVLPRLRHPL
jgi:hypothetical protein